MEQVVDAIERNVEDVGLQRDAIGALCNLAENVRNKEKIGVCGGVERVVDAMG